MELIDRAALEEHLNFRLNELRAEYGDYDQYTDGFDECVSKVEDFKLVDAVPVVRCKDCVYWENGKDYEPYCTCINSCMEVVNSDDFCSYGERRVDNGR